MTFENIYKTYPNICEFHIWVSKKHKYLCNTVPKNACTRIKASLYELERNKRPPDFNRVHTSATAITSLEDPIEAITSKEWFRFAFVRNPYDRLFSAYKSKIVRDKDNNYTRTRNDLKEKYGYKKTDVLPFTDFVDFVVNTIDEYRDHHWQSQTRFLIWDKIRYDYIGRFETFQEDFALVLYKLQASDEMISDVTEVINSTLKVPLAWVYNRQLAELVYNAYKKDFKNFGYDKDSWRYT